MQVGKAVTYKHYGAFMSKMLEPVEEPGPVLAILGILLP